MYEVRCSKVDGVVEASRRLLYRTLWSTPNEWIRHLNANALSTQRAGSKSTSPDWAVRGMMQIHDREPKNVNMLKRGRSRAFDRWIRNSQWALTFLWLVQVSILNKLGVVNQRILLSFELKKSYSFNKQHRHGQRQRGFFIKSSHEPIPRNTWRWIT